MTTQHTCGGPVYTAVQMAPNYVAARVEFLDSKLAAWNAMPHSEGRTRALRTFRANLAFFAGKKCPGWVSDAESYDYAKYLAS
jgi:hypothetical protein